METILVIDDERLMREFCIDILASAGYRVLTAPNAREGFKIVEQEPVRTILLDMMMPEVSGIDALKVLGEKVPDVPVIMITAFASERSAIDSLRFGAYDFVPKPFQPKELLHAVERALERYRLRLENRQLVSRLEEMVEERTKELRTLLEVSQVLASTLDLDAVLPRITEAISRVLRASRTSLLLLEQAAGEAGQRGPLLTRRIGIDAPFSLSQRALQEKRPVAVGDIFADPALAPWHEAARRQGFAALVSIPLLHQERAIGVLDLFLAEPQAFSEDKLRPLLTFANQAAIAIENARLFREVERRNVELVQSQQLTEDIIANMRSGLLVIAEDGRVSLINRHGEQTLRCAPGELIGQRLTDRFPTAQPLTVVGGGERAQEVEVSLPDGTRLPLGYSNSRFADPAGRPLGTIVVFRDLTEIKRLQEELRRKDRLAAIGQLANSVAHEVRNPLFGISSVAQILAREVEFQPAHRELVAAMLAETRRLNAFVEDLLLYSRPPRISSRPTDIHPMWEELLALQRERIQASQVAVRTQFDARLRPLPMDAHKIRQVFLNLLQNALEASQPGGQITITTLALPAGVQVAVADTGSGIPPEDLERIFDLFFTTKPTGSGFGLAICKRIVEDHGGAITAHSRIGQGSLFTVTLPYQAPA
jgi:PAS domain S-box-containing protein